MSAPTFLLDDVVAYLEAFTPTLSLTFATNLYAGLLPDSPDATVALFEYAGPAPIYLMGPRTLPAIAQPDLQVIVRDINYPMARQSAEAVARALEEIVNETVNTTFYERVARKQDPFFLRRDAVKTRVYFCCNFEVMREPS